MHASRPVFRKAVRLIPWLGTSDFLGRWLVFVFFIQREFSRSNPWNIWWSSCIVQKLHMCDAWNVPMWKRPPGWFWEDAITRGHFVIWRCGKQRLKRIYNVCRRDCFECGTFFFFVVCMLMFLQAGATKYFDAHLYQGIPVPLVTLAWCDSDTPPIWLCFNVLFFTSREFRVVFKSSIFVVSLSLRLKKWRTS